jgi:gliding motility-associated-like protein
MKQLYQYLVYCCCLTILSISANAQLIVNNLISDEEIIQSLAGEGVIISNIAFDCPPITDLTGCPGGKAYGQFTCGACGDFPMNAGLMLTSGCANDVGQAASNFASSNVGGFGGDGDPDLEALGLGTTNDACDVIFDVQVAADTLTFNYVFASEEYDEFVCSTFTDVFGLFVNGPNPAGGTYVNENVAIIPGTNVPVAINTVNDGTDDNPGGCVSLDYSEFYTDNAASINVVYDGMTVKLQARIAVIPCETYTLKFAIADIGDSSYDSGVFIEAGSLQTSSVDISATTSLADAGFSNAIEGCVDGIINFDLDIAPQDTITVYFEVTGTATNGVDFVTIPDSIMLYPGDTTAQIIVSPIADNQIEGLESVKIQITNQGLCNSALLDSVILDIQDNIVVNVSPASTILCAGAAQFLASGALSYQWSPATGLSATNIPNPVSTATHSTEYMIIGNIGPCVDTTYANVILDDNFNPNVPPEYTICAGQPIELSATGGSFTFWDPPTNLSCSQCPNPIFSGTEPATYTVTLLDAYGCNYTYPVTINVGSNNLGLTDQTIVLCNGESETLNLGSASNTYSITPTTGLSCADCPNPTISSTSDITYTVTASSGSCSQTATIQVSVNTPSVNAGEDVTACETVNITLGETALPQSTYLWSPTTGLSNATAANPNLDYSTTTAGTYTYTVTITDSEGCTATDAVNIVLDAAPAILIAQPDTVVQGGSVTLSVGGAPTGASYAWSPSDYLSSTSSPNPIATPLNTTTYTVTVTTALAGCTSTASVTVPAILPPTIILPSGFSPNGDGLNDFLKPIGRDIQTITHFEIFNRWGRKLYSLAEDTENKGWDGKFEGTDQDIGVYAYYIEYYHVGDPNTRRIHKGNITLVR